jgi:hypothetical protein
MLIATEHRTSMRNYFLHGLAALHALKTVSLFQIREDLALICDEINAVFIL